MKHFSVNSSGVSTLPTIASHDILQAVSSAGGGYSKPRLMWLWNTYSGEDWVVDQVLGSEAELSVNASGEVHVWWGDGTSNTYNISGQQTITHNYSSAGTYIPIILGGSALLTGNRVGSARVGFARVG